ncbi:MAG: hypothetical protein ACYCXA_09875 [Actinomycetes bacterium]
MNEAELERFLRFSAFTEPSLRRARPHYPRLLERLRALGVTRIPEPWSQTPEDARAANLICLMIKQGSPERNSAQEHDLRNITGIRPAKAWSTFTY